jgi:soluble lytic murein transglycosylase-like protein
MDGGPRSGALRRGWVRWGVAATGAVAVVIAIGVGFAASPRPAGRTGAPAQDPAGAITRGPLPTGLAAVQTRSPAPAHSSARPSRPAPSRKPTQVALPPPPHPAGPAPSSPAPGASASCPSYFGPAASRSSVRDALTTAADHHFWPVSAPSISVPHNLMYAIAWQESGWQSTILACDGGIGTMQIMPDTATWMNNRFDTGYDVHTLAGNTALGAEYLEWLIKYFGDVFFGGSYDLSNQALLDSVISAYNVGAGAVDPTKGSEGIPNWRYVDNVEALMVSCPCLA